MQPVTSFESDRYFSQAEFADWCQKGPDDLNRYELLNGRIVMNPPSAWPQGELSATLASLVHSHVRPRRLGRVFGADQGFELPSGDTVGPDSSWVSNARWEATAPHASGRFLKVVPDLVAEVLSPSTASRDRGEKKAIYERNGVTEYWLVDPAARRISRFALEDCRYGPPTLFDEGTRFESLVLPGLGFDVAEFFASVLE